MHRRIRTLIVTLVLALAAVALPGCAGGLKQALGLDSENAAPTYTGVGMVVLVQRDGTVRPADPREVAALIHIAQDVDSSGNQGAEGDAAGTNTTEQKTDLDPAKVVKAVDDAVSPIPALPIPLPIPLPTPTPGE